MKRNVKGGAVPPGPGKRRPHRHGNGRGDHQAKVRAEKVRLICEGLAAGGLIPALCQLHDVPLSTFFGWVSEKPDSEVYARARESRAHAMAERLVSVAAGLDDPATRAKAMVEAVEGLDPKLVPHVLNALENNAVQRDRLLVDSLKWLASRTAPRHYGDKVDLGGGGTITVHVRREPKRGDQDED